MKYGLLALAFLLPSGLIFADTTGFADGSVWISKTPIVEGEVVQIHAALTNGSDKKLTGSVVFKDAGTTLGTVPFSLEAGDARIVTFSWKATPGAHAINASISNASDAAASDSQTVSVSVAAKPVPESAKKATATSAAAVAFSNADDIESAIGTFSPKAQELSSPAFQTIDSWRKSGAEFLGAQSEKQQAKIEQLNAKQEDLRKNDTPEAKSERRTTTIYQVIATVLLYLYGVLLFVVSKAGVFYPLFAALILYFLFKGYQRVRRPTQDY